MKHIVLIAIALLVLLTMPAFANQVPPVEVNGLVMDSSDVMIAINTDCLIFEIEQTVLEKVLNESNLHLSENLIFDTIEPTANSESTGGVICYSYDWLGNIGYHSIW